VFEFVYVTQIRNPYEFVGFISFYPSALVFSEILEKAKPSCSIV
jgi:hypothetical protein